MMRGAVGDRLLTPGGARASSARRSAAPPPATAVQAATITRARSSGRSPSSSMWTSLASSSLSMIGNGSAIWRHDSGPGSSRLPSAPIGRAERRDELLADGVERRVGHLGEQLLEVVEQQPRPVGQHGDRRVGAHRADRLAAGPRHRRDEDLQLLVRVAEDLLAAQHRLRGCSTTCSRSGRSSSCDEPCVEPLARRAARRPASALISSSSTMRPCGGVDEEHAARLQAALLHDLRRVDVEHADLAGHDHEVVVGDPVAAGPQAVAVEHRADDGAVGEGDRRRAVPRLHQRRVEPVEGALRRRHRRRGSPTPRGSSSAPRAAADGRRGAAARAPRRSWPCRTPPGVQIGKARSSARDQRRLRSSASRARIQLRLPCTVLISPLWAM